MKRFIALCASLSENTKNCGDCWEGTPDDPKSYRTAVWAEDETSAWERFKARNHNVISLVEDLEQRCPRCGGKLWRRTNFLGKRFYCCSNYKTKHCKYTEDGE